MKASFFLSKVILCVASVLLIISLRNTASAQAPMRTLVFEENFDSNTNWQFNNNYSSPNFSSYPGINGWENGPMSGDEHSNNAYLNITDGIVWGCSVGYGTNPQSFEPTTIHREISVDSAGFEVEFRAISQSSWPNQVRVSLMSDWVRGESPPRHYGFVIYGESANHTIDILTDFAGWYYRKYVGSIVNSWHTYKFVRLYDGSFELYIDGNKYAGFTPNPDLTYTTFNRISIDTARQGSKIDWVKVYELTDPSPESIISDLIDEIKAEFDGGTEKSLTSKLDNALSQLDKENDSSKNILEALINQIEALRGKKLTDEQADDLIATIQEIIGMLNGPAKRVASQDIAEIPETFSLSQNSPNPFNPSTTISYGLPAGTSGYVTLKVYDLRGALVKTLVNQAGSPGMYSVVWDGMDISGNRVSSGVYIYQIQAGEFTRSNKMMLMR